MLQPSPLTIFPSSHCSKFYGLYCPFPHLGITTLSGVQVEGEPEIEKQLQDFSITQALQPGCLPLSHFSVGGSNIPFPHIAPISVQVDFPPVLPLQV